MKKIFVWTMFSILAVWPVHAQDEQITYVEEMQLLGAVAGQGLACQAEKYDSYELLARAIMITKASSNKQQAAGMQAYNEYKASAFMSNINNTTQACERINKIFNRQKIFKATLFGDGTIKMPDGKVLTPRHPYDATKVYTKEPDARAKYLKIYNDQKRKIENDPNFQRAINEQKRKYGF